MKKLIIGFILGSLIITGISYGYRIPRPQRITEFNQNGLIILNENLERLWDVVNGRISLNSGSLVSTGTGTVKMGSVNNANNAGWLKIERTDGTMVYIPYWLNDLP